MSMEKFCEKDGVKYQFDYPDKLWRKVEKSGDDIPIFQTPKRIRDSLDRMIGKTKTSVKSYLKASLERYVKTSDKKEFCTDLHTVIRTLNINE